MSRQTAIRNLQVITAIDSLSYGLVYPLTEPYIESLGGTQVMIGTLAVLRVIGTMVSAQISEKICTIMDGKRNGLLLILSIIFLTNLLMFTTSSYCLIIFTRIILSAVNQTQNLCLQLLLHNEHNLNNRGKLYTNYSILSGSGYIFGPVIAGHLLQTGNKKGIRNVCIVAALLTLSNIILITTTVKPDKIKTDTCKSIDNKPLLIEVEEILTQNIEDLKKSELETHWDIVTVKFLFASSILIFITKFRFLLRYNCNISSRVYVGYTTATINTLVFASSYYIEKVNAIIDKVTGQFSLMFASEVAFFLITVLMFLACYAPTYSIFMTLLILIVLMNTVLVAMWSHLFTERQNESLKKLNHSSEVAASLTTPLLFGLAHNQMGYEAVILFIYAPMLLCWVIIRYYSRLLNHITPIPLGHTENGAESRRHCD